MSEKKLCTIEELQEEVKNTVSEKRYKHCLGVKKELQYLFDRYGTKNEIIKTDNYDAPSFLGLAHDWAREYSNSELFSYCKQQHLQLDSDQKRVIVLAHGLVASDLVKKRCMPVPNSWLVAINEHTNGNVHMGYLGLHLFVADFIEETRSFLKKEDRDYYHSFATLNEVGKHVLNSMLAHWTSEGIVASKKTQELERFWAEGREIE